MDVKKPDRTVLKSYFVENAVPTAGNFADLIDGLINQKEDGIAKLPGEPLSVQAEGVDGSEKKALNFYGNFADSKPVWTISLNPRAIPADAASAKPGWSLGDGDGNSKLFIDQSTGNVGIGTVQAGDAKLTVVGSFKAASNVSGERAIGMETPANANHRGDGAQAATGLVYRVLKNPASGDPIFQVTSSGNAVRFFAEHDGWTGSRDNSAWFGGARANYFKSSVGIGTTAPAGTLDVKGTAVISNGDSYATKNNFMAAGSLTVGGISSNYGGGSKWNNNVAGLLLETSTNTEVAVHDSGTRLASLMYYEGDAANRITIGRDMGWGTISQVVFGGAITPSAGNAETAGIMFPANPGGGGGDAAWIRYYPRTGEACTLEIGVANDANDHIALMSSGNVGIGTYDPKTKLEVNGAIAAGNSDLYFTKTDHNHTGFGNTAGYAAIENAANYDSLMILGRAGTDKGRKVRLWDYLEVNGRLDVTGDLLGAAKNVAGQAQRVRCGATSLSAWVAYGGNGIYVDIDTSQAGFGSTPVYVASLAGNSSHWSTTGGSSIYSATKTGFRVYVRWVDGKPLTPAQAAGFGWYITWIAIGS